MTLHVHDKCCSDCVVMATFYLDDYGVLLAWTIDGLHVDRSNASGALHFLLVVL